MLLRFHSQGNTDPRDFGFEWRNSIVYQCLNAILSSHKQHLTTPQENGKHASPTPCHLCRRATIRIDEEAGLPTHGAIQANAVGLARYAAISQAAGLTPIVEPELLIEGTHSPELFAEVMTVH